MLRSTLAGLFLAAASAAAAQSGLHPIAADLATKLPDPDRPFVMVVELQAEDGLGEELVETMAAPARKTAEEAGNLDYRLSRSPSDPDRFVLYERWRDLKALDQHLKTPYLDDLLAAFDRLLAKPPKIGLYTPVTFN